MSNDKRSFLMGSAALAVAAALPHQFASAASEGKDYRLVNPPQRTEVEAGKIEVLEFFWYGCPHCYALEPVIDAWAAKLPDDVQFRRAHVNFRSPSHQQIYYTLLAMGEADKLGLKVFEAMHKERKRMTDMSQITEWAVANGLDEEKFVSTYNSFGVKTQMTRAERSSGAYGVDGVPMIAVNGKYLTSPSMTGSNTAVLKVVEELIELERKGG